MINLGIFDGSDNLFDSGLIEAVNFRYRKHLMLLNLSHNPFSHSRADLAFLRSMDSFDRGVILDLSGVDLACPLPRMHENTAFLHSPCRHEPGLADMLREHDPNHPGYTVHTGLGLGPADANMLPTPDVNIVEINPNNLLLLCLVTLTDYQGYLVPPLALLHRVMVTLTDHP